MAAVYPLAMSEDEHERRERLAEITAQICRAAASASDDALVDAVANTNAYLGIDHDEHGVARAHVPLAEHFADVRTLREALDRHAPEARAAAILLLARIDPAALLPHWRAMSPLSKRGFHAVSWAGGVAQAATSIWYAMTALLPPDELGEMFLRGETTMRGVPEDVLVRLPIARIVTAIRERTVAGLDHDDAQRLARHPDLASVDEQARVLAELLALPKDASGEVTAVSHGGDRGRGLVR
jgi:hypothetical protein